MENRIAAIEGLGEAGARVERHELGRIRSLGCLLPGR